MRIETRLKGIERQLGIESNIQRKFLTLCHPEEKSRSEAEKAEQQARIDRAIEEAKERSPTCPFLPSVGRRGLLMVQSHNLKRRLEKIENRLEPEKGQWLRLPDGEGGYIEVPGCRTWMDMVAISITSDKKMDETKQK